MQTIPNFDKLRGGQTLKKLVEDYDFTTVLDVGSGDGHQAKALRECGKEVTETDYLREGDFMDWKSGTYDLVLACHVLEHQLNVNAFLKKCKSHISPDGFLAVVVPPAKHQIVGGHLTLWNAGLLMYNLILAGFDCSQAEILSYGYNVSVIVKNSEIELPVLGYDCGDIDKLAAFFPPGCSEPFDGRL
jgi:SAM-dependent methyltransferase